MADAARRAGRVYLVGAGPGDPGLLTVRAAELLARCDVVVYDYLAEKTLLRQVPAHAERIYVGKTGAHKGASARQERIHEVLIERARRGLEVVRLKGGDPFVFGRGGEEAEELAAAGVAFEVVPGVSSAVAVPAYAGIPVTHRDHNTAMAIVTGHEDPSRPEGRTDWIALAGLAARGGTVVILMGMKHLRRNLEFLLEAGAPADVPTAVIQQGTRAEQRTLVAPLAEAADAVERAGIKPPAVVVVGQVVALRERIAWFERRPLAGRRVLVTRAADAAPAMERALLELGAEPVTLPTLEIQPPLDPRPLQEAARQLQAFDWVVLGSANAVAALFEALYAQGLDARAFGAARIGCVGTGTARALEAHGLRADLIPDEHVSDQLAAAMIAQGVSGRRVLLPQAAQGRDALTRMLRAAGATVEVVTAYRTAAPNHPDPDALRQLREGRIDVLTFASPSSVRHLAAMLGEEELRRVAARATVACIGQITAEAARQLGLPVHIVPAVAAVEALVEALIPAV